MAEATEPRLSSWRIRTQTAKPQTKAENSRTTASAVESSRSPQHTTRLKDPPRPPSHPAPRATPRRESPGPALAGSRASQKLAEGEHHPQERRELTCRGGARRGGGAGARGGASDAREGGVQRPVDCRCHCPDRPLGLGRARMLCASLAAESGGVAGWLCARRFGCHDVVGVGARRSRASGTGRLRRREVELGVSLGSPRWAEGGGLASPRPGPARAR